MADAVIGALRVVLGADTGAFEDGLKKADKQLSSFAAGIAKTGAAIGVGIVAGATALAASVRGVINEADKLGKLSQSIGIPVEQLSELSFAAQLADISLESLGTAVVRLSKNMATAAAQTKGEAADAFRAVGISITDTAGKLKSSDVVLGELADKFAQYEDGAAKTALAVALFGRAGASIIPLLNEGSAALLKAREEAHQFGIVISAETAKAAEDFNDNLTRLNAVSRGWATTIAAQLAPSLKTLTDQMVKFSKESQNSNTAARVMDISFKAWGTSAIILSGVLEHTITLVSSLAKAMSNLVTGRFADAFSSLAPIVTNAEELFRRKMESIFTLWTATGDRVAAAAPNTAKKIAAPIIQSSKLIDAERQKGLALLAQIDAEQESILARFRTPAEEMVLEIQKINDAFARGILTQEQWGMVTERIQQRVAESVGASAASVAGSISDLFQTFGSKNKALGAAAKAFAIAQATINTYLGATKALATTPLPPPAPQIAAAAVIATGLAQVAKIVSTPAFAKGGSFMVPGGISGVDTSTIPLDLAAGERVDITPASQARQGGGVTTIELRTPRVKDFFTENIRELVDSINAAAPDGYIIRMPA